MTVKYKYPEIDLLKLLATWTRDDWAALMIKCVREGDIERLKATLYGIQRGMSNAVKKGVKDEETILQFANMTRSIEVAAKEILRRKYPCLLDAGTLNIENVDAAGVRRDLRNKRLRDLEFQKFIREARF